MAFWSACNPAVSAAGFGLRDQRRFDFVKSAVPNGEYRVNLAAPSPFRPKFLAHQEPIMMSGARAMISSAVIIRSFADLQIKGCLRHAVVAA